MKQNKALTVGLLLLVVTFGLNAQSGAIVGEIQGVVSDPAGAPVPNARVTALNTSNGATRETTTEAAGVFHLPLLTLGSYKVTVSAQGFSKYERTGIELTAGAMASVNATLKVGTVSESVTVVADSAMAEPARVDIGATINTRAVENLPLISRNVYNFILLQPGISATPNTEFGVPRKINANGFDDRIDYQLDGGNNTESDRKGIRLMPISQTFISEIVESSNGFAPEFGNTTGTVFNAVTNSGSNNWHGSAAYIFRTPGMTATPSRIPLSGRPSLKLRDPFGTIGGPIKKDKLFFFASYEKSNRTLPSAQSANLLANAATLGIPASDAPGAYPFSQANQFAFGRVDWQINDSNRLMGRYMYFRNNSPFNPQNSGTNGGTKTISTASTLFVDRAHAAAVQLLTTFSPHVVNEFRFAYGYRNEVQAPGPNTPSGINIVIANIADFGGPDDVTNAIIKEVTPEFVDNLSWVHGSHSFKFGGDVRPIYDTQDYYLFAQYNFSSVKNYLDAKSGVNPKAYSSFVQTGGNPNLSYTSVFMGFFAQDNWTVTPRLSVAYGLRYDLYKPPAANSSSALPFNSRFRIDKNNLAPRLGIAYQLTEDHKTVLRANTAIFYDTPATNFYQRAILNNGNPQFFNATLLPTDAGAPLFPNVVPGGSAPLQSVNGIATDFATLYAFNTNLQLTRELRNDMALTVGYLYTKGTRLPIARNINFQKVTSTLADGRPVYSTLPADKVYPQFGNVYIDESVGNSNYNALTVSLNKRFAHGLQMQANYAWSHAIDNAPEENVLDSGAGVAVSDPTSIRRDRGNSPTDRRHIITVNGVWDPSFKISNATWNYLLNHNQLSFLINGASGDVSNIVSNLNLVGYSEAGGAAHASRPLYVGRNTFRGQRVAQFDFRYSRFIPMNEHLRGELLAEATNVFNHSNVLGYGSGNNVVLQSTTAAGVPNAPFVPLASATRDPRYIQIGFKLLF